MDFIADKVVENPLHVFVDVIGRSPDCLLAEILPQGCFAGTGNKITLGIKPEGGHVRQTPLAGSFQIFPAEEVPFTVCLLPQLGTAVGTAENATTVLHGGSPPIRTI